MAVLNFIRVQINPIFWIIFFSFLPLLSAFFYFKMCKIHIIQSPQTQNNGFWISNYVTKPVVNSADQMNQTRVSWRLIYVSKKAINLTQKKQFNNLIKALGKHQNKVLFESITYSDWQMAYPRLNIFELMPENIREQVQSLSELDINIAFIQDPENRLILGYPLLTAQQNSNHLYDLQALRIILHDFQKLLKYNIS